MTNVVKFSGQTVLDTPSNTVLEEALTANVSDVIVIGRTEDGTLYFASSKSDGAEVLWLLEQAKYGLFQCANVI